MVVARRRVRKQNMALTLSNCTNSPTTYLTIKHISALLIYRFTCDVLKMLVVNFSDHISHYLCRSNRFLEPICSTQSHLRFKRHLFNKEFDKKIVTSGTESLCFYHRRMNDFLNYCSMFCLLAASKTSSNDVFKFLFFA